MSYDDSSEEKIQQDIVMEFRNKYCLAHHDPQYCIFSVPNEGQQRLFKTGVLGGVADLIVLFPKLTIFVETKARKGIQGKKQKRFQKTVEALGFHYFVVRSVKDFWTAIDHIEKEYLG